MDSVTQTRASPYGPPQLGVQRAPGSGTSSASSVMRVIRINASKDTTARNFTLCRKQGGRAKLARIYVAAVVKELDERSHWVAFAGKSMEADRQEFGPLVAPEEDVDDTPPPIGKNISKVAEDKMVFLDGRKMKVFPQDEAQRRKAWMELPRATRAAIRRMHHMIGHKSNSVPIHLPRVARADQRLIDGVSKFKCDDCAQTPTESSTHPTTAPSLNIFNYEVFVDILLDHDIVGERYSFLSMVCNGATYYMVALSCELEEATRPLTHVS